MHKECIPHSMGTARVKQMIKAREKTRENSKREVKTLDERNMGTKGKRPNYL